MDLIGLTGHMGAGKDEVAKILAGHGYRRVGLADPLKALLVAIDPVILTTRGDAVPLSYLLQDATLEQLKEEPEVRHLLQKLGVGAREILGPDVWIKALERELYRQSLIDPPKTGFVVADVRFENEAAFIKDHHPSLMVRVARPGYDGDGHISEKAVDTMEVDKLVRNYSSLGALQAEVENVVLGER